MLLIACIGWLLFALGMAYTISYMGKGRYAVRTGLGLIVLSYVAGLMIMAYAIMQL